MKNLTLKIPDMKCDGCVSAVHSALSAVDGVQRADVSLPVKAATLEVDDDVAAADLVSAVEGAGYKASIDDQ